MAPFWDVFVIGLTTRLQFDHIADDRKDTSSNVRSMVAVVWVGHNALWLVPVILEYDT